MYANQFSQPDLRKASKDEIKKWASTTYLLPTYHKKSNGYTAAAKVMIAMQGTYYNLFNLEYDNDETVGVYDESGVLNMDESLARLNEKIKDDSWLDANNEANRKAITLVGVRIPVQGLNSMEFAEVFEFLPPQAGNIIIPPAEIVAKSGGDFDIDKLTIFMSTLDEDGNVKDFIYYGSDFRTWYFRNKEAIERAARCKRFNILLEFIDYCKEEDIQYLFQYITFKEYNLQIILKLLDRGVQLSKEDTKRVFKETSSIKLWEKIKNNTEYLNDTNVNIIRYFESDKNFNHCHFIMMNFKIEYLVQLTTSSLCKYPKNKRIFRKKRC
jgi:hypothetical protein